MDSDSQFPHGMTRGPRKAPKKLVIVITGLNTGGAEMMLLKILERIDRQRFSIQVISLTNSGGVGPRIEALGIPVDALGMTPGVPNPFAVLRLAWRLRKFRPDMVHTMMYHANLLGGVAAMLAGVRAISWGIHHCDLSRQGNKRATLAVVAICATLSRWVPNVILNCSEVSRRVHIEHGYSAERMVVVPNGFDVSRFRPDAIARVAVRRELGLAVNTPLVGLIGRFDPQKNHAGFFDAVGMLHRRLPNVRFVLAGNGIGTENNELMGMIEAAGVISVTHLLGLRSDIPRLMAALDVLASSSIGEAFPNVLGEAMASGVPCAVTDVGDSAYIVGDTGRVVASRDMAGLAAALESLLILAPVEWEALGLQARARVVENFEIGSVVRLYEKFYVSSMSKVF
jgi:glycosyltransferase involved in cell wall biosynthesis